MKRLAILRLIIAAALTLAVLPVSWGYTYVTPMILPEFNYFAFVTLTATLVATFYLTRRVGLILSDVRWTRWIVFGVAGGWVASLGVLAHFMTVPTSSTPLIGLLFVLATVWLPCTAWLGYQGVIPIWKWLTLAGFGLMTVLFPILVRVDGLTGDLKVEFAWRMAPRKDFSARHADTVGPAPTSIGPIGPDDSPQYFGPNRDGIWPNARLADWTERPPTELWRRSVGPGWSSIAIAGGYCFTQEQRGEDECVTCYHMSDGSPVWTHAEKTRFISSMGGDGPRATPTMADGRCYAVGATGHLVALDAASGKKIWSVDLLHEFGGDNLMHGVCNSPLVVGEKVIACPCSPDGPNLAAYHRETGALLWAAGTQRSSYSSPALWQLEGQPQVVVHNSLGLAGHDPADGKQLWLFPWTNADKINCSQPILDAAGAGTAVITTGYGTGAVMIRVKREAPDRWLATEEWKSPKRSLKTKFTSAVKYEGNAYGLDEGILACVEIATGKLRWKEGRYQHGQVIIAGDRLIVQAESGDLVQVVPSATGLKEAGRISVLEDKAWAIPVIAGRRLIVRNDHEMACYELAER